jgi:cytochrome P450
MFERIIRSVQHRWRYRVLPQFTSRAKNATTAGRAGSPSNINPQTLDFFAYEVRQNPYPYYEALRQKAPAHFLAHHNKWIILNHDDVSSALKQPQIFSSAINQDCEAVLLGAELGNHKRVRRLVTPHFSAQVVQNIKSCAGTRAEQLLNQFVQKSEFDIVSDFSRPLTEQIIGELLGLETAEIKTVSTLQSEKPFEPGDYQPYFEVLQHFFAEFVERKAKKNENTLCKHLLNGDDALSEREVASLFSLFWAAGTQPPAILISTAVLLLLQRPAMMRELSEDFDLIAPFIEEVLRFDAPEQFALRRLTANVDVSGVKIPEGAAVYLCLGAANRDPEYYSDPDALLLHRNSKDHLAFGAGPHYCVGAGLGRTIASVALEVLLQRFPTLYPAQNLAAVQYSTFTHARSFDQLPVKTGCGSTEG